MRSTSTREGATEVVPGIWRVRDHGAFSYIVKLSPGAVLVDTGPEASGRGIMRGLQAARVGIASLRAILLTSVEPDAAGGLRTLTERSGAPAFGPLATEELRSAHPGELIADHFLAVAPPEPQPGPDGHAVAYYFRPARAIFCGSLVEGASYPIEIDVDRVFVRRGPERTVL